MHGWVDGWMDGYLSLAHDITDHAWRCWPKPGTHTLCAVFVLFFEAITLRTVSYAGETLHCKLRNMPMNILYMITSSNGNIFRVTGPLCGEFTGPDEFHTQRPVTRSFDVFFDLRLNKRLSKQPWGWWFEALSWSLWRHCNDSIVQDGIYCIWREEICTWFALSCLLLWFDN